MSCVAPTFSGRHRTERRPQGHPTLFCRDGQTQASVANTDIQGEGKTAPYVFRQLPERGRRSVRRFDSSPRSDDSGPTPAR